MCFCLVALIIIARIYFDAKNDFSDFSPFDCFVPVLSRYSCFNSVKISWTASGPSSQSTSGLTPSNPSASNISTWDRIARVYDAFGWLKGLHEWN